ncbi:MAG: BlaI/MecI/CopY family transcriptional regulator [Clostridiales bacterium]|nr:BlaI/MecI/CopY family transcriptional regulator [Clostridiales bacterium]
MATQSINLTEAEWKVMECLWERSPRTGREITERLEELTGWKRSTTLTLLQRMEAKGAVESASGGSKKTFRPLLRREDAALRETEDFLGRVYKGSLSLMVSSLTRKQALPQEEIDELYTLLREMEEKNDG